MSIRNKIKRWIFKEEFSEIEELRTLFGRLKQLESDYEWLKGVTQNSVSMYKQATYDMNSSKELLNECRKTMNAICDVGTDVGLHSEDHSWAVICIHGKMDYVKFVPMSRSTVMDISRFLKQFEYSNRCIDSPFGYSQMIEDCILRL